MLAGMSLDSTAIAEEAIVQLYRRLSDDPETVKE